MFLFCLWKHKRKLELKIVFDVLTRDYGFESENFSDRAHLENVNVFKLYRLLFSNF